jgi:hypothetical protein
VEKGVSERQDLALRLRLNGDVRARSSFHRERLRRAGFGSIDIAGRRDLRRLPPMTLGDIATPGSVSLSQGIPTRNRRRNRRTRRYWPSQWMWAGVVPLGYSREDLDLLTALGLQVYERAGISRADVVVSMLDDVSSRDSWQLRLGARRMGLSFVEATPRRGYHTIDALSPTVLVGDGATLQHVFDTLITQPTLLGRLHTVIVVDNAQAKARIVARLGSESSVIHLWAPEGVLAAWSECRGGTGLHTWPEHEVVEVVDVDTALPIAAGGAGSLLWTGTGWFSSALIRLQTEAIVRVDDEVCPACGRRSARLEQMTNPRGFVEILDTSKLVGGWVAELQRVGDEDRLAIWTTPSAGTSSYSLLAFMGTTFPAADVTLTERNELQRRMVAANGERYVDRRALPLDEE